MILEAVQLSERWEGSTKNLRILTQGPFLRLADARGKPRGPWVARPYAANMEARLSRLPDRSLWAILVVQDQLPAGAPSDGNDGTRGDPPDQGG